MHRLRTRLRNSRLHLVVCAVLVGVAFAQRIDETTFDTKFDLTADPLAALGRSLQMWGTEQNFGGLQNQAYGYLFPQGTWFALTDLAGTPDWIAQRLWSAVVLLIAYDGARRLARAMGIGRSAVPVVVGLAYATAPRLLGLSGVLSAEILPSAVLPWVCLPLVLALNGRMSPRRAGLLAGLAFLATGGVNAVENLATLPLPFLIVASGVGSRSGRRLAGWWLASTAAAASWWMLPLLLLGKYSPPFLDYVETAATTTRTSGWSNSVRGAEHWLNYIVIGGEPWWTAAHSLSTDTVLVLCAAVLAAAGLIGLTHRSMPLRIPLGLSVLVGLVCLTVGHGGPAGTPLASVVRDLLDGPLAPFRNVHKVDPLIRLPLALGFGVFCLVVAEHVRRSARLRERAERVGPGRLRHIGTAAAVLALLGAAAPAFADELRHPGWDRVPAAWEQATAWLDRDGPGTTLVVPSSGIGQQTWGWTVDEPIQGLADGDWATRTQVPLVPPPTIRMLDGLDERLEDGGGSEGLAGALAAAGITRVLLRNDLDTTGGDVADAARVAAALTESPGFRKVRSFGRSGVADVPMIEIFRVEAATTTPTLAPDGHGLPLLTGGPEDVITARDAGLIGAQQHVRVGVGEDEAPAIVSDGYRRVERQYGRLHGAISQVMTAEEKTRLSRRVTDYPGVPGVPLVVAEYDDLSVVTASSSAGYVDGFARTRPELGPASAVDGDPATYWSSAEYTKPVGQWVRLDLKQERPIGVVTVRAVVDRYLGAPVRTITIEAGDRSRRLDVDPGTGAASTDFGAVTSDSVRVRIDAVGPLTGGARVGLRDITVAGLDQRRTLVVPDSGADANTSFAFTAEPPRRACLRTVLGPICDIGEARPGAEQGRMSRRFTLHGYGAWSFSGQVVALPSPAAARALEPLGDAVTARSDSVLGDDPAVSAMFAVDGRADTSWLAQAGDLDPVVTLSWKEPRRISRLTVRPSLVAAATPYLAEIQGADGDRRTVEVGSGELGYFAPFRTDRLTITFRARPEASGVSGTKPVGVAAIDIAGIEDLVHPVATNWSFAGLCGLGPAVTIDGTSYRTQVRGTLGDIVDARPLQWTICGKDAEVTLPAGIHRLEAVATDTFTPTRLVLRSAAAAASDTDQPSAGRTVSATVRSDEMRFKVGSGDRAVLVLGQNENLGWEATLDGKDLSSQIVDGWQQGFVIPAGDGGEVVVRYAPSPVYRAALGAGALAALLLVVLLLFDLVRPAPVSGSAGRRAATAQLPRTPSNRLAALALVVGLALGTVLGGPVFGCALAAGVLGGRFVARPVIVAVGAGLVAASGVVAVVGGGLGTGEPTGVADVCAALGVGILAATLSRFTRPGGLDGHA